jgi:hypothetical protein
VTGRCACGASQGALVTGRFYGNDYGNIGKFMFGDTNLSLTNSGDNFFVMHVTSAGVIDWAKDLGPRSGSGTTTAGTAIASNGVVAGYFSAQSGATTPFGPYSLTAAGAPGSYDMFVLRVSPHPPPAPPTPPAAPLGGALAINSAIQPLPGGETQGLAIAADGSGGYFVTGWFKGSVRFGADQVLNSTLLTWGSTTYFSKDVFVAHMSGMTVNWVVSVGGDGNHEGKALVADGSGGCFVTGDFEGAGATFGTTTLSAAEPNSYTSDIFVMHISSAGVIQWAVRAGGTAEDEANGILLLSSGGVLVSGDFWAGPASFGSSSISLTSAGSHDILVFHVTSSGVVQWASQAGSADGSSNIAKAIAHDNTGGAWVCGDLSVNAVTFGTVSITTSSPMYVYEAGFLARINSAGTWQSAFKFDNVRTNDLVADGSGGAFIVRPPRPQKLSWHLPAHSVPGVWSVALVTACPHTLPKPVSRAPHLIACPFTAADGAFPRHHHLGVDLPHIHLQLVGCAGHARQLLGRSAVGHHRRRHGLRRRP